MNTIPRIQISNTFLCGNPSEKFSDFKAFWFICSKERIDSNDQCIFFSLGFYCLTYLKKIVFLKIHLHYFDSENASSCVRVEEYFDKCLVSKIKISIFRTIQSTIADNYSINVFFFILCIRIFTYNS